MALARKLSLLASSLVAVALSRAKSAPLFVRAGTGCGFVAGVVVGMMLNPPVFGVLAGAILGTSIGALAGVVMDREERRRIARTRELDETIGITSGSLGVPPGSIPPAKHDLRRDVEGELDLEPWAAEWLTPPPPRAT